MSAATTCFFGLLFSGIIAIISSAHRCARRAVAYSQQVLDHFERPRNVGELSGADAEVRVENPVCGDIMNLWVKLAGGRIEEVKYRTRGCVASIAAGSCLTEMIKNKSLTEARSIKREQLVEALGGLPNASSHASYLAMDALAAVLKRLADRAK